VAVRAAGRPGARGYGHIADSVVAANIIRSRLRRSDGIWRCRQERSVKPSASPTLVRTQDLPPPAKTARTLRKRGLAGRFLLVTPCSSVRHCGSMHGSVYVHMVYSVRAKLAVRITARFAGPRPFCPVSRAPDRRAYRLAGSSPCCSCQAAGWFTALDNGFAAVDDPAAVQAVCDSRDEDKIEALARKWLDILPSPCSKADQAAGYRYDISVLQAEFSLTQVLDRPLSGRIFFDQVIHDNLAIGRPDQVGLIFGRRIVGKGPRPTPGRFRTRVITDGVTPSLHVDCKNSKIKQYHKLGKALRTETTVNDTRDFGIGKRLTNLPALRQIGFSANRRLLAAQILSHDPITGADALAQVTDPVITETGTRVAGLRLTDPRALALLAVLCIFRLLPNGFTNADLRRHLAPLLGKDPEVPGRRGRRGQAAAGVRALPDGDPARRLGRLAAPLPDPPRRAGRDGDHRRLDGLPRDRRARLRPCPAQPAGRPRPRRGPRQAAARGALGRLPGQALAAGHPPGPGRGRAPAELPERVLLPLQPAPIPQPGPGLLPRARTRRRPRSGALPAPDRSP
jgi:hypothetical protein